jgi:Peptidase family M28
MLNPRIYRAALLPALLAVIVAAFSVQQPPAPLTAALPPDSFSAGRAFGTLRALAEEFPSRAQGSRGDQALAGRVRSELRAAGFRTQERFFEARTADGRRELSSVVGQRAGSSERKIVVVAHRDALDSPATAQLSGTAGLIELARVFRGRTLRKTLVLASTSGGSAGAAGATEVAEHLQDDEVDAVIVLGDLAGRDLRRPLVVPWSNGDDVAPIQLRRTVEGALNLEGGLQAGSPGSVSQFDRLAFPYTIGEQGEFVARGLPAVLLSASGERGPGAERRVSMARMGAFGRATLRTITAYDAERGTPDKPKAEIYVASKVLPGWAVGLLSAVLILPVLLAAIDGLARVRRRGHPVGMWVLWVLSAAMPFAAALAFGFLLRFTGLMPTPPPGPSPAGAVPLGVTALAVMLAMGLVLVVSWLAVRPLLLRLWGVRGDPGSPGAAAALVLVLVGTVSAVWFANPFAALLLTPILHGWMLITAPEVRIRRGAATAVVGITLLPVALVALYYAFALGYGPLELIWNGLLFAVGGAPGLPALVIWCLLLGCLACVLAVVRSQGLFGGREPPEVKPAIRGPITYAGPGSLGGTESALRR